MLKRYFPILILMCLVTLCNGQNNTRMHVWQDSLQRLGKRMFQQVAEAERLESNFSFVKTLVSALKEPNSYFYNFDKLTMISVVNAPDNAFRIFSWNLPLQDGSFLYYGTIQHKAEGGKLKLTPLLDKTFEIKNASTSTNSAKEWYGAQYYEIVPLSKNQYILLGWKGHHAEYTKKVIEVLTISPTGVTLGSPVFANEPTITRKIFSYTKAASMYLQHNKMLNRLEMDHIAPATAQHEGNYKYYGPDLSYDGYAIKNGKLIFQENIELNNPIRGDEDKFVDPLKPNKTLKSGF